MGSRLSGILEKKKSTPEHAVGFTEAMTVFGDPLSITVTDPDNVEPQVRFVTIGMSGITSDGSYYKRRSNSADLGSFCNNNTKKPSAKRKPKEMRPEYDFAGGVRGKYAEAYAQGTNVVLLDPELTSAFPDSKSVNDALRALLAIAKRTDVRKVK
jgi:hypothetical protein